MAFKKAVPKAIIALTVTWLVVSCDIPGSLLFPTRIESFLLSAALNNGIEADTIGVIDESGHLITLVVPAGAAVSSLVPTISHTGVAISPDSGVAQDFSSPVIYTVTSESGASQTYSVTVLVASSESRQIISFELAGVAGVAGVIDETAHTISVPMPAGTAVNSLVPTISHTGVAISPDSGVTQDFSSPVIYTVTAESGAIQTYTVVVLVASSESRQIISFELAGIAGAIDETAHTISVPMPAGTVVNSLIPTISHTGVAISPDSGVAQDFSSPVIYTVTAESGATQMYSVYPVVAEGGGNSDTYSMGVWAEITIPVGEPVPPGGPMIGARAVDAWSENPEPVAQAYIAPNWDYTPRGDAVYSAYLELHVAEEGDYRVVVWGETDGNKQPDWNESVADAVWWHSDANIQPEGGFWDNIFGFSVDDTEYGTWREGVAIIWSGGDGAAPNYQFRVNGTFIKDENDIGDDWIFEIKTADPARLISDFSWDLYSASYAWVAGQWVPLHNADDQAMFTISDATMPKVAGVSYVRGWYWLEVNMTFTDRTYRYKRFPVRIIAEAASETSCSVTVNIWDADWDPMYLVVGTSYQVQIRILNSETHSEVGSSVALSSTVDSGTNYGLLQVNTADAFPGLNYNATDFTDGGSTQGVNLIEITVDSNSNGAFGSGDFTRRFPISLDATDLGALLIHTGGWDFQPLL
jgi:hypothetical protein